jgi:abortive infection bacteriophage resistance protein
MVKPFKTIHDQLNLLKDRGLIVYDENEAEFILEHLNYYRISGYTLTLRKNDAFYANTTFDDIMQIYNFDKELKGFLLLCLEDIEIALRTHIGYVIGQVDPLGYLRPENFASDIHFNAFSCEIRSALEDNKNEAFIKHHQSKYGSLLPSWVFVETLSFGTLSRLFSSLHIDLQKSICAKYYKDIRYTYIMNWLEALVVIRNLCAHHSRLYNRGLPRAFTFAKKDLNFFLEQGYDRNQIGKKIFFALLIIARLAPRSKETTISITDKIYELQSKYPFADIKHYGFGKHWEEVLSDFNLSY